MAVNQSLTRRDALQIAGATALVGGLAFTLPTMPAHATTFRDIRYSPFQREIEWLSSTGITTGWSDGTFRPMGVVNRDMIAAFTYRFAGSPSARYYRAFTDVPSHIFFAKEIGWMKSQGIAWGWVDGTYRPLSALRRDAMAAFFYRLLDARLRQHGVAVDIDSVGQFRDVPRSQPFAREIQWFRASGISRGWSDGTFRPYLVVRRQDMAAFIYRAALLADRAR